MRYASRPTLIPWISPTPKPTPEGEEGIEEEPEPSETPPIDYIIPHIPTGYVIIDDWDTPLGLGNIQIHVGVCYE